jgi:hypothetical protein
MSVVNLFYCKSWKVVRYLMLQWDNPNAPLPLYVLTLPSISMTLYIEVAISWVAYDRYGTCCCRRLILW